MVFGLIPVGIIEISAGLGPTRENPFSNS